MARPRSGRGPSVACCSVLEDGWTSGPPFRSPRSATTTAGATTRAIRNYNRPVRLPYPASYEKLWRDDALYDVVVVLGYNDDPPVAGRGSAVFLHLALPDYGPTAGCVALSAGDLALVLSNCRKGTLVTVTD